ncbi:MAG: AtpZ/AtpI family protein [Gemmatimonadaceae bacterium]|nr:AtpZ/AtpI family protein [Gemmatimonadaceae bacterium]
MAITLARSTQIFGGSSVSRPESLAKNFTSDSFRVVEDRPEHSSNSGVPPKKSLSTGAEFAGVGLQLGAIFALSAWLGYWLDGKLGTLPWLTVICVLLGASAGFYHIYHRVIGGRGR